MMAPDSELVARWLRKESFLDDGQRNSWAFDDELMFRRGCVGVRIKLNDDDRR